MFYSLIYLIFLLHPFTIFAEDIITTPPSCNDDSVSISPQPLARRKNSRQNSAHLIGLFDVHDGNRCELVRPSGMEQVMMAISVFENRLMKFDNESQIGNILLQTKYSFKYFSKNMYP